MAVDAPLRERLGRVSLALAAAAGYVGAGTAEFLLGESGEFYFLEVNARLQVEHPVTELVTGRDLVAEQLAIAGGEQLSFRQAQVRFDGHAIDARLYAEDPYSGFVPAAGEVLSVAFPRDYAIRIDAGIGDGDVVGTRYDPLLAKMIAHGDSRGEAIDALDAALAGTHVLGVTTNAGFLRWLLHDPDVRAGGMWTTFIDERWHADHELPQETWQAAAVALAQPPPGAPSTRTGFRLNARPRLRVQIGTEERAVELGRVSEPPVFAAAGDGSVVLDIDGRSIVARVAPPPDVETAARHATHEGAASERVTAPMPGTVLSVRVRDGDDVQVGQVLLVLEAMKMENTVAAPATSRVERVLVREGQQVQRGETLLELA